MSLNIALQLTHLCQPNQHIIVNNGAKLVSSDNRRNGCLTPWADMLQVGPASLLNSLFGTNYLYIEEEIC